MFDDEKMLAKLSGPVLWSAAICTRPDTFVRPQIAASRLLWDIPVALHQAGISLHGMNLRCFPVRGNYDPDATSSEELQNDDHREALAQLDSFYIALTDERHSYWVGSFTPEECRIPDLITSREVHLFDYIAHRILSIPSMSHFELSLPESTGTGDLASVVAFYSDYNGECASEALKELKTVWLKDVYVSMDGPENAFTCLLNHLRTLSERK